MSNWSRGQQVCATCRYWSGNRQIDFMAQFYEAKEEMAPCNGPNGSFRPAPVGAGSSCSCWEIFR